MSSGLRLLGDGSNEEGDWLFGRRLGRGRGLYRAFFSHYMSLMVSSKKIWL